MPERLPKEQVLRARIYAYHFFFRRMIPLGFMEPRVGDPPFGLRPGLRLSDLQEESDEGLDVICRGILSGTPFIFPAEKSSSLV